MKIFGFLDNRNREFQFSNRVARIWYLKKLYGKIVLRHFNDFGIKNLLLTQFPFAFPDAKNPPSLTVEFTNLCNLKCPYCTSPVKIRKGGLMDGVTFNNLVKGIVDSNVKRVRIVGNGEPTIHPEFSYMIRDLKKVTPVLALTTNGQFIKDDIIKNVLTSKVDILNISVDSMIKSIYESRRPGGNFDDLIQNLRHLRSLKKGLKSKTMLNIRVMLTPSDLIDKTEILNFWKEYADVVSIQYVSIIKHKEQKVLFPDQFTGDNKPGRYPKCSLPFKILNVLWNGDIPLCTYSEMQTGTPEGLILGNINLTSLSEIWNHSIIKNYRNGHRRREEKLMPICNGCIGT